MFVICGVVVIFRTILRRTALSQLLPSFILILEALILPQLEA